MEQKLRDFVRTEIVNRFLAKRSDYPYGDPNKLEELSQKVVSEMATEMPTLEPLQEVCKLYDLVDKVADMLAATFAVRDPELPSSGASSQDRLWEPLPTPVICSEMWQQFYWDMMKSGNQGDGRPHEGNGRVQSRIDAAGDPFWHDGLLSEGGQNWIDDQESCGSIDLKK